MVCGRSLFVEACLQTNAVAASGISSAGLQGLHRSLRCPMKMKDIRSSASSY